MRIFLIFVLGVGLFCLACGTAPPVSGGVVAQNPEVTTGPVPAEPAEGACRHDSQCKQERLCIGGECISKAYAEAFEARYMSSMGIVLDEPDDEEAQPIKRETKGDEIVILVRPPPSFR